MKFPLFISIWLVALAAAEPVTDDAMDRLDDALTWSAAGDTFRARVSGTAELETYHFQPVPTGFIHSDGKDLLNPRLVLFLDAQAGAHFYLFAQSRVDRGFDPGEGVARARLDEYAVRFTPFDDAKFSIQVGKFATVVGNWTARHLAWDNPFIGAPLPYESLTGIFDEAAVDSTKTLLKWSRLNHFTETAYLNQYRLPILWGRVTRVARQFRVRWERPVTRWN